MPTNVATDWDAVPASAKLASTLDLTAKNNAANAGRPGVTLRTVDVRRVVVVPRALFRDYVETTWADMEADAFAGLRGLRPARVQGNELASGDEAWFRQPTSADSHDARARGVAFLYSQGW